MPRPLAWGLFIVLVLLSVAIPAAAQSVPESPTLSTSDRLNERRYVTTGTRAYEVGTEAGRYPAMGFHTRGEMGGVWSPPIKLLDGLWFGIGDQWIGPATKFTSGYGHVKMDLPDHDGMTVTRTDFVPDGKRAVLVGLEFAAGGSDQNFTLKMDAHSELMGAYPWGETNPNQTTFNKQDSVTVEGGKLVFREQGARRRAERPAPRLGGGRRLEPHPGRQRDRRGDRASPPGPAGERHLPGFRPQRPARPARCDDTAYGKGKGGQLRYEVSIPANTTKTVWFAVAGADFDGEDPADAKEAALAEHEEVLDGPGSLA